MKKWILWSFLIIGSLQAGFSDFVSVNETPTDFEFVDQLGMKDAAMAEALSQAHDFKGDLIEAGKKAAEKAVDNVVKENQLLHTGCVESIILGSNILGPLGYGFDRIADRYNLWWMPTLVLERLRRGYAECICDNVGATASMMGTAVATENPAALIPLATKCVGYMLTAAYNEMTLWAAGIAGLWSWGKNKVWSPSNQVVAEEIRQ